MEETSPIPAVPKSDIGGHSAIRQERAPIWPQVLTFVVGLAAVASIGAVAWVYADMHREIVRVSTDIAQLRVSLELYGRQAGAAGTAPTALPSTGEDGAQLLDLSNRLSILEQNWRGQAPAAGALDPSRLPDLPGTGATAATAGAQSDCMPQGTRFLVSAGDNYPVCDSTGKVEVLAVDAGYVSFVDGTIVPAGGSAILTGTRCTLAVTSSGADGMTGYAELRVSC